MTSYNGVCVHHFLIRYVNLILFLASVFWKW